MPLPRPFNVYIGEAAKMGEEPRPAMSLNTAGWMDFIAYTCQDPDKVTIVKDRFTGVKGVRTLQEAYAIVHEAQVNMWEGA